MRPQLSRIILCTLLLLGTTYATIAQAQEAGAGGEQAAALGEQGAAQTPVEVIVQIVVTGIVLKVLDRFNLP